MIPTGDVEKCGNHGSGDVEKCGNHGSGDVEKCGNHGSGDVEKCGGFGVSFRPDGIHELDPCIYETIEKYKNVTVTVSRCRICGHTEIAWERQPETEEISEEE